MKTIKYISPKFKTEKRSSDHDRIRQDTPHSFWQTATFDIGFRVLVPLLIFIFLGRFLDDTYQTKPLFVIVGIIVSCCFIFMAMLKLASAK